MAMVDLDHPIACGNLDAEERNGERPTTQPLYYK